MKPSASDSTSSQLLPPPRNEAEQALFSGEIQGLIVACPLNERPLQGLAGLLDWRLRGAISGFLRQGVITGKPGECVYLPISWHHRTLHLLVAGAGHVAEAGTREKMPEETLQSLRKNLKTLRLEGLGVSKSDFGDVDPDYFVRQLKSASLAVLA